MSENEQTSSRWAFWGNLAAALWIIATTVIYFMRFTAAFYRDNQGALNDLFERLGLGFLVS